MPATRRVVLVGAGHAHIEVLRQWAIEPPPAAELLLVVDSDVATYSGMVPGFVAGQYSADQLTVDGGALAKRAGAEVVHDAAVRIDPENRCVHTKSGRTVSYDLASLDVGSTVAGRDLPGVEEYSLPARPIQQLIAKTNGLVARVEAHSGQTPFRLLIVGGGAGGVELAFCFEARLTKAAGRPVNVALADRGEHLMSGAPQPLVRRVERAAVRRGIEFRARTEVASLDETGAVLTSGERLDADAVVWVPGAAAHAFLGTGELPVDARGFVKIRPTLQVESNDTLFAVGDCASLPGMRKAGVYAVRTGPVLVENLRRSLAGQDLQTYHPQSEFLSLLNLGNGTALGIKKGFTFEGRWVMRLKDWIDRRFMEQYK